LNAELGLLAVALTPILIAGGIDLSVGAVMGLAAVCFGAAWRDLHMPIPAAVLVALLVGALGGGLNALLISRLKLPALIVTLGTFSLFRGVAEGITEAAVNYSGFPPAFLALGQGYIGGVIPAQLPIFLLVLTAYAVLLHRSVIGRALYAIGFVQTARGSPASRREQNRLGVPAVGHCVEHRGRHLRRPSGASPL
jgi:rhamnose transport system permease protein